MLISVLLTLSLHRHNHDKSPVLSDDEQEGYGDYIYSPRLNDRSLVMENSQAQNQNHTISPLASKVHISNKTIIASESKNLRELSRDMSFQKNLKMIAKGKNGLHNIPITKLMNLPLDLSHIKSYENAGLNVEKERISSRTFYGNGNFLSK